jgi:hypothetical protein
MPLPRRRRALTCFTLAGTWTGIIATMDERPSFPLPTNGWNPTKRSQLARISGILHATLSIPPLAGHLE